MTEPQLDNQGEAHEALNTVVADFGQRVLSDPRMLESRMSDLIPDLERERGLMVTAARSDVASDLTRHVQEQRLDPDTAVQLVSRSLTDRTSIDAASSMWVTTQYAQALGYQVRSDAPPPPPPSSPGPVPPAAPPPQETVTSYPQYGSPYQGTAPQQDPTVGAPGYGGYSQPPPAAGAGGYGGYSQPQGPAGGAGYGGYPQPPAGGGGYYPPPQAGQAPPGGPTPGTPDWASRPPKKRNRGLMYGLIGGGVAVVLLAVIGIVVGTSSHSSTSSAPPPTHVTSPAQKKTTPASTSSLAAGVAPLVQLLPSDVNPANCKAADKPGWATPGLVQSYKCTDSGVGTGYSVFAYQMNSSANYASSWANFNTWWGYNPPSGSGCPPSSGDTQGSVPWDDTGTNGNGFYPAAAGQTLECGMLGSSNNEPTYAWSFPSEDAYIIAIGDQNSTFSHLDSWWTGNSDPNKSPSPAAP